MVNGHRDAIKSLLRQHHYWPDQNDVSVQLEYGPELKAVTAQTPVHWALTNGHQNLARLLNISNNCDSEAKDNHGQTPLSLAARYGHVDVVKQLLEKGADYEAKDSNDGRTPLSWAAMYGHVDVVKQLDKGGECKTRDKGGQTPLYRSLQTGAGTS
ncbi:Uu.00g118430.m01.CDS01 [Anthostomella pinea]|uniref:Uu.00g118430.m01.CDS01 n=1 Tax=Anthostomella pinea TaxID=933095 RepID=A0AAI8VHG0_9PEZI|nr:Uu.00g118430.m01.CDS01 [Anthostomella pinea]